MTTLNKFQQPGRTKVINGSVLSPESTGLALILSPNNLAGKYDEHPLFPLFEKKWRKVKPEAKGWYANKTGAYKLGAINTTAVQSDAWVVHMLVQDEKQGVSEDGIEKCLKEICKMAKFEKATVHVSSLLTDAMPELTSHLKSQLVDQGVSVYFYNESKN